MWFLAKKGLGVHLEVNLITTGSHLNLCTLHCSVASGRGLREACSSP